MRRWFTEEEHEAAQHVVNLVQRIRLDWLLKHLPPRGVWAAMSCARCPASRACWVIQVSAQCLWQGTSLTGDRHKAGLPQHTHGASGPVAARVQSRMTGPAVTLVAWDMPRSPVLSRGRGTVLAGRAGG